MIEYCINAANLQPHKRGIHRVYACVVDKQGRIVGESRNSYVKTHPLQKSFAERVGLPAKEYLHAEVGAIIRAKGRGVSIYVARVDSNGYPVNAKPCPVCELAIRESGHIENIYYT